MGQGHEEQLAEQFAEIARRLRAAKGPERTREAVTQAAVATVGGCRHAAISYVRRTGEITTVAATDDVPLRVDALQYVLGEGPCLDAIGEEAMYQSDDLEREDRWARFSRRAVAETGVHSMLAYRLFVDQDLIGALNLYSGDRGAFDEHSRGVGAVLAAHAAIAIDAALDKRDAEQLHEALPSNRQIGMAMGILMARRNLTEEQAFAALRRASQYLNTKLRDVAASVVHTGDLPQRRDRC